MQREPNVGTTERWLRAVGGGIAAVGGLGLVLGGPGSFLLGLAYVVLTLLGIDFFVTGLTGYCPLYHQLGWSTIRHKPRHV